jgi:GntR family transcriptional regulator
VPPSAIPLWVQIQRSIREMILSGKYQVGDRIPPESELTAMYGVSRMTVRQAVQHLVREGLLTRGRGRGTFVSKPPLSRAVNNQYLDGFFTTLKANGHSVVSQVLAFDRLPASPSVATGLELAGGVQVYRLERLRFVDDEPISIQTTYLPALPLAGLDCFDFAQQSLYQVLKDTYSLPILAIDQRLSARAATTMQAQLLQVPVGSPLLYVEKVSRTVDEQAIEFGSLWFVPAKYQLTMAIRA